MNAAFGIVVVIQSVLAIGALGWGIYIAYLLTRALRKYLRS